MSRPVPEAQRIVVVGGTGGLGSAVVEALLARGDRVLATGRDPDRLEALRRRGAAARPLDLGDPACGAALAAAAREELGDALDGLALVAGRLEPIGPTRTVDLDALARTLDEHVLGALRVVQACAPLLDAAAAPSVVLFSGGGATGPFPRYSAYALAKVATVRLAENLAAEEPGWRVNAVAPGFVATGMHETTLAADRDDVGPLLGGDRAAPARRHPSRGRRGAGRVPDERGGRRHQRAAGQRRVGPVARRGRPGRPARPHRLRAPAAHRRPALPRPPGRALRLSGRARRA